MSNIFDYLAWRGDILFSQVPPGNVDALIFSTLAYVDYDGIVPEDVYHFVPLREVVEKLFATLDFDERIRVENDKDLLLLAAESERFGRVGMCHYQNVFIPEEETQFAAVTFLLEDGSAFLAFRGTDNSLVGWKEDFNMTFQESIPAQRLAKEYVRNFASTTVADFHVGGHSKGGNLAVYAAAKNPLAVQRKIIEVYNHDGPGFKENMMTDPGYLAIVPKIQTFVPQSSVFGMLLEHKEPYTIIKSKKIGIMQHDPYTWEVMGNDFILVEELTADSRFLDRTMEAWLADMTNEERNEFVDAVFDLMMAEDTSNVKDILKPQNVFNYVKTLKVEEDRRKTISVELQKLLEAAKKARLKLKE